MGGKRLKHNENGGSGNDQTIDVKIIPGGRWFRATPMLIWPAHLLAIFTPRSRLEAWWGHHPRRCVRRESYPMDSL